MSEVTREELKSLMKEKFGSVKRFAAVSEIKYNRVRNILLGTIGSDKNLNFLYEKAISTENRYLDHEISPDERKAMRVSLGLKYISIKNFCDDNNMDFSLVYSIIDGTTKKKNSTYYRMEKILSDE